MELALCLSGGGYRAALYHLGVLTILNELRLTDQSVMLDHVHTITSISGGALTGMRFVISEAEQIDRKETFKSIYRDIVDTNIGDILIERFDGDSKKGMGVVQTLADIYNDFFFHDRKFSEILNYMSWDGIHHFYADATDFDLGIPFRFQATAQLRNPDRPSEYGMVGNWQHKLDREVAMNIRLADIMAATSCFPLVFEPIMCPKDFQFSNSDKRNITRLHAYPLMDGGLIDNQGIEPAIHAAEQMIDEGKEMDVMIICDAANGVEEDDDKKWNIWDTTPDILFMTLGIMSIISIGLCYWAYDAKIFFASGVFLMMTIFFLLIGFLMKWLNRKACSFLSDKTKLHFKEQTLWDNTFSNIGTFVKSRVLTAYKMTDAIMTGHMKKLWFRLIYEKKEWENKIVTSSLNVFSREKTWKEIIDDNNLPREFRPENRLLDIAEKASKMKTTLWFTKDELQDEMPHAIVACGRYTTCWNLLVYVEKLKSIDKQSLTANQKFMISQSDRIKDMWNKFQSNPLYNIDTYTP